MKRCAFSRRQWNRGSPLLRRCFSSMQTPLGINSRTSSSGVAVYLCSTRFMTRVSAALRAKVETPPKGSTITPTAKRTLSSGTAESGKSSTKTETISSPSNANPSGTTSTKPGDATASSSATQWWPLPTSYEASVGALTTGLGHCASAATAVTSTVATSLAAGGTAVAQTTTAVASGLGLGPSIPNAETVPPKTKEEKAEKTLNSQSAKPSPIPPAAEKTQAKNDPSSPSTESAKSSAETTPASWRLPSLEGVPSFSSVINWPSSNTTDATPKADGTTPKAAPTDATAGPTLQSMLGSWLPSSLPSVNLGNLLPASSTSWLTAPVGWFSALPSTIMGTPKNMLKRMALFSVGGFVAVYLVMWMAKPIIFVIEAVIASLLVSFFVLPRSITSIGLRVVGNSLLLMANMLSAADSTVFAKFCSLAKYLSPLNWALPASWRKSIGLVASASDAAKTAHSNQISLTGEVRRFARHVYWCCMFGAGVALTTWWHFNGPALPEPIQAMKNQITAFAFDGIKSGFDWCWDKVIALIRPPTSK